MIEQNNIKDFAIAAFRYRGHIDVDSITSDDELTVVLAVSSTVRHLQIEQDTIAVEGIKRVYYNLPLGNIKRGVMSNRVRRVAYDMHISESVLWRGLRHARYVFNRYYKEFTSQNRQ